MRPLPHWACSPWALPKSASSSPSLQWWQRTGNHRPGPFPSDPTGKQFEFTHSYFNFSKCRSCRFILMLIIHAWTRRLDLASVSGGECRPSLVSCYPTCNGPAHVVQVQPQPQVEVSRDELWYVLPVRQQLARGQCRKCRVVSQVELEVGL